MISELDIIDLINGICQKHRCILKEAKADLVKNDHIQLLLLIDLAPDVSISTTIREMTINDKLFLDPHLNEVGECVTNFVQNPPKPEDIAANMKRLGELGLQVQVTEMDVKIHDGSGTQEERVAAQTKVYRDILQVCLEAPNCTAFLTWEFADHHSWIPDLFGKPDSPLPFDNSYRPKAAYHAMVQVLKIDS
ncbi:endo-1,4-beta-xylanase [Moorena sp. SIO3I6]|uniref:endo-1,4-beta-xylanase n=1 Tax=Moorena sp. SIO3I6 TaxID=2607831 RepID=UPI0013F7C20A|nr:endo-1,4-beta-xylanase [Moorena sp. SIO3I6]NEP26735.1 endo-1,4-beta-xylanase [Moorena sp. SIO3I6]